MERQREWPRPWLSTGRLPGVGDQEPIVHLLLLSPGMDQLIGSKLPGAQVLQNLALLLDLSKQFELAAL
jgi:hypothetical protein